MNRRGFFGFLAAGCIAAGTVTRFAETKLIELSNKAAIIELMTARINAAKTSFANAFLMDLYGGYECDE